MSTSKAKTLHAAAHETTAKAEAAFAAATDDVEVRAADIEAAESHVVEVLERLNAGKTDVNQDSINQARGAVEQARKDFEWSLLRRDAAEAAQRRAIDAEVVAARAVTAEEYAQAHKAYNNPDSRENLLSQRLREDVAELVGLINKRHDEHDQLARDVASWPADERPRLAGKPIIERPHRAFGTWSISVPLQDVAEAITEGLAAAAEQARAEAQAQANN